MLRHLEEELECTLLIREGRKLRLTDSGQAVYQRGLTISTNSASWRRNWKTSAQ